MMRIQSKNFIISLISIIFIIFTVAGFIFTIKGNPGFIDRLNTKASIQMIIELALVFVLLFMVMLIFKSKQMQINLIVIIVMLFSWFHSVLFPMLISVVYVIGLSIIGKAFLIKYRAKLVYDRDDFILNFAHEFLIGSSVYITFICALSIFKIGSMGIIRICTLCMILISALFCILYKSYGVNYTNSVEVKSGDNQNSFIVKFSIAYIVTMFLLQVGRLNIALDYDSLRYGLRTRSILNNGNGIYENLGFVNDIYVYPKGFEILGMPLNFDISYGFVLAFSTVLMLFCLLMIYRIAMKITNSFYAIFAVAITVSIPAIMNMGVSAKTDIITLLIQLMFVCDIVEHLTLEREEKEDKLIYENYLLWAVCEFIFSIMLKPTSIFFLGGVLVISFLYLMFIRKCYIENIKKRLGVIIFVLIPTILVTLRTYIITGFPITSIFSTIFMKLGFHVKYPFHPMQIPSISVENDESMRFAFRLFSFLVAPIGEDMRHVLIAMPTSLVGAIICILVLTLPVIVFIKAKQKEKNYIVMYLYTIFITLLFLSLYALKHLYQVDGNYFMLLYIITVIMFIKLFGNVGFEKKTRKKNIYNIILFIGVLPAFFSSVIFTSISNWAGAYGFTPRVNIVSDLGKSNSFGFYNHRKDRIEMVEDRNIVEIYNYLIPNSRLLSMDNLPDAYIFPCSVQSYTDLEGSGGNPYLVKKLDIFKEYLDYAHIDYIFVNDLFLESHSRAEEIVRFMLEDGSLEVVEDKGENALYKYIGGK